MDDPTEPVRDDNGAEREIDPRENAEDAAFAAWIESQYPTTERQAA